MFHMRSEGCVLADAARGALWLQVSAAAPFQKQEEGTRCAHKRAFPSDPNLPASPQSSGLPGHLPRAPVSRIPHEAAALLAGPPQPGWSGRLQANELCAPPGRGPVTWPGIRSERH